MMVQVRSFVPRSRHDTKGDAGVESLRTPKRTKTNRNRWYKVHVSEQLPFFHLRIPVPRGIWTLEYLLVFLSLNKRIRFSYLLWFDSSRFRVTDCSGCILPKQGLRVEVSWISGGPLHKHHIPGHTLVNDQDQSLPNVPWYHSGRSRHSEEIS